MYVLYIYSPRCLTLITCICYSRLCFVNVIHHKDADVEVWIVDVSFNVKYDIVDCSPGESD